MPPLNSQQVERGTGNASSNLSGNPFGNPSANPSGKPSHKKQVSLDSGVGSTCSIHRKNQPSFQRARSISENSITEGRLTVHDIPTEQVLTITVI